VNTDEDLGQWLRQELVRHESLTPPASELAARVVADARRVERRRAWMVAVGATAAAAAIVGGSILVGGLDRASRSDVPPAGSSSGATSRPDDTSSPAVLLPGMWAGTLPIGDPPEVPYGTRTHLYLPSGQVVDLHASGSAMIGQTVAGTVVLVEQDDRDQGGAFRSWYAVVLTDGTVTQLDDGRLTGDRVQEAVVSPDGRWFADGRIFDMTTGQIAGVLPDQADIIISWTPVGIVYGAGHARYLWSPGGPAPVKLAGWGGDYANGAHAGIGHRDGCNAVLRLAADGSEEQVSRHCGAQLMTVSPSGTWALTRELVAIDTATGEQHPLAGAPVRSLGFQFDDYWLDENELLLSVPAGGYQPDGESAPSDSAILVRCRLETATCERATEAISGVWPNLRVELP